MRWLGREDVELVVIAPRAGSVTRCMYDANREGSGFCMGGMWYNRQNQQLTGGSQNEQQFHGSEFITTD